MARFWGGLACAMCVAGAAPAAAEDWYFVGRSGQMPERVLHFIDRDSVTVLPNGRKAFRVSDFLEKQLDSGTAYIAADGQADCETRRQWRLKPVGYRLDGSDGDAPAEMDGAESPLIDSLGNSLCRDDWEQGVALGARSAAQAAQLMLGRQPL